MKKDKKPIQQPNRRKGVSPSDLRQKERTAANKARKFKRAVVATTEGLKRAYLATPIERLERIAVGRGAARRERRAALQEQYEKDRQIIEHRQDKELVAFEVAHLIRRAA